VHRSLNPAAVRAPFGRYSHGVAVPAGARFAFCSGQLGITPEDAVPATIEGQAEQAFRNISAILAENSMDFSHVVRLSAYVTSRENMKKYMDVRDRFVTDPLPASTLLIVSGFTRPEFLVEVEAIAAKVD
jgi:enamine deaminase RidA (YjgF/YER057c/UK114 family)